jgi:hypothetical protein
MHVRTQVALLVSKEIKSERRLTSKGLPALFAFNVGILHPDRQFALRHEPRRYQQHTTTAARRCGAAHAGSSGDAVPRPHLRHSFMRGSTPASPSSTAKGFECLKASAIQDSGMRKTGAIGTIYRLGAPSAMEAAVTFQPAQLSVKFERSAVIAGILPSGIKSSAFGRFGAARRANLQIP